MVWTKISRVWIKSWWCEQNHDSVILMVWTKLWRCDLENWWCEQNFHGVIKSQWCDETIFRCEQTYIFSKLCDHTVWCDLFTCFFLMSRTAELCGEHSQTWEGKTTEIYCSWKTSYTNFLFISHTRTVTPRYQPPSMADSVTSHILVRTIPFFDWIKSVCLCSNMSSVLHVASADQRWFEFHFCTRGSEVLPEEVICNYQSIKVYFQKTIVFPLF